MNGTKPFLLTRYDGEDIHVDILQAKADMDAKQIEAAMRAAVAEFLQTDDGKQAVQHAAGRFNWGDAITYIPDDVWNRHGIYVKSSPEVDTEVVLNHNEILSLGGSQ